MRLLYWVLALLLILPIYAYQPPTCEICTKTFINLEVQYGATPTAVATLYGTKIDYRLPTTSVEQLIELENSVNPSDFAAIGLKVEKLSNENVRFFVDTGEGVDTEICGPGVTTDSNGEARCEIPPNPSTTRFVVYATYEGKQISADEAIFASNSNAVVYASGGLPIAFDVLADSNCFIFFIILGVLIAGMYASGKNPLNAFDIATPKLPKPKKVGFRRTFFPIGPFHTKRDQLRSILETHEVLRVLRPEVRQRMIDLGISAAEIDRILSSKATEFDKAMALRALLAGELSHVQQILEGEFSKKAIEKAYKERKEFEEFTIGDMETEILRGKRLTLEMEERMMLYDRQINGEIEKAKTAGNKERLKALNELLNRLQEMQRLAHTKEVGQMALDANKRGYGVDGALGMVDTALDWFALAPQIYIKNRLKPKSAKLVGSAVGPVLAEVPKKIVDVPVTLIDYFVSTPIKVVVAGLGIGKLQGRLLWQFGSEIFRGFFGKGGELVVGRAAPALREVDLYANYNRIHDILMARTDILQLTGPRQGQMLDELRNMVGNNRNAFNGDIALALKMILVRTAQFEALHNNGISDGDYNLLSEVRVREVASGTVDARTKLDIIRALENVAARVKDSVLNDAYLMGYREHDDPAQIEGNMLARVRLTHQVIEDFAKAGVIRPDEVQDLRENIGSFDEKKGTANRWALEKIERLARRESLEQSIRGFLEELRLAGRRVLDPLSIRIDESELEPVRTETGLSFYSEKYKDQSTGKERGSYDPIRRRLDRQGLRLEDSEWGEIVRRANEKTNQTIGQSRIEGGYNALQAIVGARFGPEALAESVKYGEPAVRQRIQSAYETMLALDIRRQVENLFRDASIKTALKDRGMQPGDEVTYERAKKWAWIATPDMEWVPYFPGLKTGLADTPINATLDEHGRVITIEDSLKTATLENFFFKFTRWIREPIERGLLAGMMTVGGDLWRAKVSQEVHRETLLNLREQMLKGQLPTLFGSEVSIPSYALKNTVTLRGVVSTMEQIPTYISEMQRIVREEFSLFGCNSVSDAAVLVDKEVRRAHNEDRPLSQEFKNLREQVFTFNQLKSSLLEAIEKLGNREKGIKIYDESGTVRTEVLDLSRYYDPNNLTVDRAGLNAEVASFKERLRAERDKMHQEWEVLSPLYEVALGFHRMQRSITATIYKTPRIPVGGYGTRLFGPGVFPFGPMAYDEPPWRAFMGVQPFGKALGAFLAIPFQIGRIGGALTRPFAVFSGGLPDLRDIDLAMMKHPNMVEAYASLWQFWKFWNYRIPEFKKLTKTAYYLQEEEIMAKPAIKANPAFLISENLIGEWGMLKNPADTQEEAIHELPWFLRLTASGVTGYPGYWSTRGGRSASILEALPGIGRTQAMRSLGRGLSKRGEYAETVTGHGPMLGTDSFRVVPEQIAGTRGVRAAASRGNRMTDFTGTTLIDVVNGTAFQYYRWGHLVTEAERRAANFDTYKRNLLAEGLIEEHQQEKGMMGPFGKGYEMMWATLSPLAALTCMAARSHAKKYLANTRVGRMLSVYPQTYCQSCGIQTAVGQPCRGCSASPTVGGTVGGGKKTKP